jgi:hypothetical protein
LDLYSLQQELWRSMVSGQYMSMRYKVYRDPGVLPWRRRRELMDVSNAYMSLVSKACCCLLGCIILAGTFSYHISCNP